MFRLFAIVLAGYAICHPAFGASPGYFGNVQPLLTKYCAGCHNTEEANGEFALHDYASLMRGGENGAVLVAGKADESRLIKMMERTIEPAMPPDGEARPKQSEIEVIKAWINAGAEAPSGDTKPLLHIPNVRPVGPVREPVHAIAWSADGETLAVGRYEAVDLLRRDLNVKTQIDGLSGHIRFVKFLPNGLLVIAGGEPGFPGEIAVWDLKAAKFVWRNRAHDDAVMCGALDSSGKLIATGSYDQSIIIWDVATGDQKTVLTGHNGPVFGLAFHPSKAILASASGDRTIKLWDPGKGERLDTFTEPTQDQLAIAFSPEGNELVAAGADSRVRVWRVSEGRAGTNRILLSHFAHEGPIIGLVFSEDGRLLVTTGEDRSVKIWDSPTMDQVGEPRRQADWVQALAVRPGKSHVTLGGLDGTLETLVLPEAIRQSSHLARGVDPIVAQRPSTVPALQHELVQQVEREPNDEPRTSQVLSLPMEVSGVLDSGSLAGEADCYRFSARAGETWIFETNAARTGSPADTKIDVLNIEGKPVERIRLRAVRDSAVNFRGFSAVNPGLRVDFWEEMELNEFMYLSGEVCRIFRMPQGPDSDMQLYSVSGQRRSYFDTTPVAHALFEAVYIVEAYPGGAELPANGLPVFSLPFENDDDSERKLGSDSKLTFTAPADGDYVVRVRDTRGFGGPDYRYTLLARKPQPDFNVALVEKDRTVPKGGGQRVTFKVDRIDGFDGPVSVEIENLPEGFKASSPIVIEAGHSEAKVSLTAAPDAESPSDEALKSVVMTATGDVQGRLTTKAIAAFNKLVVAEKPKILAHLTPVEGADKIVVAPNGRVRAMLKIERNGYEGEINFEIENLPHGVIVDHIGLSGVLIRADENEREIEFYCADWVKETLRPVFAAGKGQGEPTSEPVRFVVTRDANQLVESRR